MFVIVVFGGIGDVFGDQMSGWWRVRSRHVHVIAAAAAAAAAVPCTGDIISDSA